MYHRDHPNDFRFFDRRGPAVGGCCDRGDIYHYRDIRILTLKGIPAEGLQQSRKRKVKHLVFPGNGGLMRYQSRINIAGLPLISVAIGPDITNNEPRGTDEA